MNMHMYMCARRRRSANPLSKRRTRSEWCVRAPRTYRESVWTAATPEASRGGAPSRDRLALLARRVVETLRSGRRSKCHALPEGASGW
jgi:hypothetical protein